MMKNRYLLLLSISVLTNTVLSQGIYNYHSGNKLRLTFSDVGRIENSGGIAVEWPIGTGHEYLDLAFPIVVVENNSQKQVARFKNNNGIVALNHKKESWPVGWNGHWHGFYGTDSFNADQESWFTQEDTDLKLRLTIRGFQWSHYLAQDMIFLHFELTNYGASSYQNAAFGFFIDPAVGGDDDDIISLDKDTTTVIIMDEDNKGKGRGIAKKLGEWSPVGRLGVRLLEVPDTSQIGMSSFAAYTEGEFDINNNDAVWSALSPGRYDQTENTEAFVMGSGRFALNPGDTLQFSLVIFVSVNELDIEHNQQIITQIYTDHYTFPVAPSRPSLHAVAENDKVTLYWDTKAEIAPDFEGYKIYRSSDPGFNDIFTVTDGRGIVIYSDPIKTFDVHNDISGLFSQHVFGFRYYLGNNSGLKHHWTDTNVINGKTYYYAVTAFDRGNSEENIYPTESTKSIIVENDGNIIADINTAVITPIVESSGYQSSDYTIEHISGFATGDIIVEIVDRTLIEDRRYQITFDDSTSDDTIYYSIFDITDSESPFAIMINSSSYIFEDYFNDISPFFIKGLRVSLRNYDLAWNVDRTYWRVGNSNWDIALELNKNLGTATPVPTDYEVRFGESAMDTAIYTHSVLVPFQIWNITDSNNVYKENILVVDNDRDKEWDPGERIFIVEGNTVEDFAPVYWSLLLSFPEKIDPISPDSGDVLLIYTHKPFTSQDIFTITTQGASIRSDLNKSVLDDVAVIPNPYIVYSGFEQKSLYTGGTQDRKIQFINLPQKCKIRIFSLRGYPIKTLEHNSEIDNGSEFWDLRNKQGNVVAYGVYIYHLDAPDLGTKVGKFAIIR